MFKVITVIAGKEYTKKMSKSQLDNLSKRNERGDLEEVIVEVEEIEE